MVEGLNSSHRLFLCRIYFALFFLFSICSGITKILMINDFHFGIMFMEE